ncbi:MAG TPA: hypothetical protein VNO32_01255, partial [Candidatus Acidoferrum sp.]|nr:hypothetical protein [Candidatus Acidoferrum sp.]
MAELGYRASIRRINSTAWSIESRYASSRAGLGRPSSEANRRHRNIAAAKKIILFRASSIEDKD